MDASYHPQSSDQLLSLLELSETSLKAESVDEFAKKGLVNLSDLMEASGAFLYLKETKHFPVRFVHHKLQPDVVPSIAGQAESFLPKFSADGGLQPILVSVTPAVGQGVDIHAYKLHNNGDVVGTVALIPNGSSPALRPEVSGRVMSLVVQTIDNLLADEETAHHLVHLRTFQTVCSMFKQTMDLHELLDMALYAIMDVVSAEAASVLLLTDDKKNFSFYVVEGNAKPVIGDKTFPTDTGIAGSVLLSRQSEIIHDVQNDPRFYRTIDSESGFKTRNMIVLPLIAGEEPVGVLEVINKEGGKKFTEKEHLLLCSIAEEIAFAIRNAKVFDYVVGTYCRQRQGQMSCKGCRRPLGSWTPCVKYQESEFKKSAVVEQTIYHDLRAKSSGGEAGQDRRHLYRKDIKLPAFIGGAPWREKEFETGTILNISLDGIRFSIPKRADTESLAVREDTEFSIIFILADEQQPVKAICRAKWVLDSGEDIQIGATFLDNDSHISQALQKYLI